MVGSWTRLLSSNQVLEVRYGYTQDHMALIPTQLTNPVWQTIPGRNNSDPYQPSAPIIDPSDRVGLGDARSTPLIRNQHMHEVIANMNWQRGSHNILFGAHSLEAHVRNGKPSGSERIWPVEFQSGMDAEYSIGGRDR